MEATVDIGLGREALRLYISEVKDSQLEVEFEEEEHLLLDGMLLTRIIKCNLYFFTFIYRSRASYRFSSKSWIGRPIKDIS